MQSLGAIAHVDFNQAASYSYEQAIQTMRRLGLPQKDLEQQVLRAMFNVVGRNQDDHVKNIAFLMSRTGEWRLSPAFDISYAYDPRGAWTSKHQMSLQGKRDDYNREDLCALARLGGMKASRADDMLDRVMESILLWPETAREVGVPEERIRQIQAAQRLAFPN